MKKNIGMAICVIAVVFCIRQGMNQNVSELPDLVGRYLRCWSGGSIFDFESAGGGARLIIAVPRPCLELSIFRSLTLSLRFSYAGKPAKSYVRYARIAFSAFFSNRLTWAWEMWISWATSVWVFPS